MAGSSRSTRPSLRLADLPGHGQHRRAGRRAAPVARAITGGGEHLRRRRGLGWCAGRRGQRAAGRRSPSSESSTPQSHRERQPSPMEAHCSGTLIRPRRLLHGLRGPAEIRRERHDARCSDQSQDLHLRAPETIVIPGDRARPSASLDFADVDHTFPDGTTALDNLRLQVRRGRVRRRGRSVRVRQEHPAAAGRRVWKFPRSGHLRWQRPTDWIRFPGPDTAALAHGSAQRRTAGRAGTRCRGPSGVGARPRPSGWSAWRVSSAAAAAPRCPVGCGCGPRWPARWCWSPSCSCSTNRSPPSTS